MKSKQITIIALRKLSADLFIAYYNIGSVTPTELQYPHLPITESDIHSAFLHSLSFADSPTSLISAIEFVESLRGRLSRFRDKNQRRKIDKNVSHFWDELLVTAVNTGIRLANCAGDLRDEVLDAEKVIKVDSKLPG